MKRSNLTSAALSGLLALGLAACSGDDGVGTTATAGETTGSTSNGTSDSTSGSTSDSTSGSTSDGTGSSSGADACGGACDGNASCNAGTCECDDGFEGDGMSCTDIDECATGKNTCDADATCTNTDGDYTCACNDGYKGNGMSCKDVDECSEGTDECSPNASCTNNDGGYACECNEGFEGDGFTCSGGKEFGEVCEGGDECNSGLCLQGQQCTVECSIDQSANDCRDQGYYGLCIFIGDDNYPFVCAGDIKTGADKDDAILAGGDSITRQFQSIDDVDIHLIKVPAGKYNMYATPDPDDDIAVAFYNIDGSLVANNNSGGAGEIEGSQVTSGGDPLYAVVVNVGNSNGSYKFNVDVL